MDLSLSPDWDARLCYGIVFLCGALSAWWQVKKRFLALKITTPLVWLVPNTWVLFAIYLFIPLALFWFMDRMNGLSDTSVFSALLVGLAYPAILAGGISGVKAPAGLAGVLKPISNLADTVAAAVNRKLFRKERHFQDRLAARMLEKPDIYAELLRLLKSNNKDTTGLADKLKKLADIKSADERLEEERKARAIFPYLLSVPDFDHVLMQNKEWVGGWFKVPTNRARVVGCAAVLVLAAIFAGAVWIVLQARVTLPYHVWRLSKPNNSAQDRARASERLAIFLQDTNRAAATYQAIARAIRSPGLPAERVDLLLQIALQARNQPRHAEWICRHLVETLHVENVDARARIHEALVFLAEQRDTPETKFKVKEKELAEWNPNKGDSVTELEKRVDQWRAYFGCQRASLP